MRRGQLADVIRRLQQCAPEQQERLIRSMTPADLLRLDSDFEGWAHGGQLPPSSDGWRVWLLMAGRGYGKTRAGAEWVHGLASGSSGVRIALVGATIDEARRVMVEGVSGLLNVARNHGRTLKWEPGLGRVTWPNGSQAQLFSGENGDGLRGPEHHFAWCDELAKWSHADDAWDNLQMGLRAGPRPRALVTTTPRPIPLLERIRSDAWTVETGGKTSDNLNLPDRFVEVMRATYGGTRLGRQELDGELVVDLEGALWPRRLIEACRVLPGTGRGTVTRSGMVEGGERSEHGEVGPLHHPADGPHPRPGEEFERIVVGVDPPAGVGMDACGIVVAAQAAGAFHVLADESVIGERPEGWARAVVAAARRWGADRVVAEANNGGAMVESVLRAVEASLPVRLVHASRGKVARAEPVAALFETGRAVFAGRFPALEDELAGLLVGGGYAGPSRSPDRADAMVWAMTELMGRGGPPQLRVI